MKKPTAGPVLTNRFEALQEQGTDDGTITKTVITLGDFMSVKKMEDAKR